MGAVSTVEMAVEFTLAVGNFMDADVFVEFEVFGNVVVEFIQVALSNSALTVLVPGAGC